jgi:GNAT superfamily N-acetyltransferase
MEPFLLDGDELIVNTSSAVSYSVGDIVLYRSPHHSKPVAHRLVHLDRQSSIAVFRSDASPLMTECLGTEAIVGKVEYVRRGERVMRVNGTILTRLCNRVVAMARPAVLQLKDGVMAMFLPAVTSLQGTARYRRWAVRRFSPDIRMVRLEESNAVRVIATVKGHYAGSLDLHPRWNNGSEIGWIASLSVRTRYRGAGVATGLLEAVERHAEKSCMQELWVEHPRDNRPAENLCRRMGFYVVGSCDGDNGNGALHRRKKVAPNDLARMDVGR